MEADQRASVRPFRNLLRFLELAGAIVVLSYSYAYLPAIARNSGAFLRRAAAILISPSFVFLVGNAIVVVLFAKSGNADGSGKIACGLSCPVPPHLGESAAEEVVFEDKEVCVEIRAQPQILPEELEVVVGEEPKLRPSPAVAPPADVEETEQDKEQFRRTVEEFIAKEQWFRRQESLAVVSYSAGIPELVAV